MGTIPPDSVGGGPSGTPEQKEPSGTVGDFTLKRLNHDQKGQLDLMMGQLTLMGHLKTYNSIVFQHLNDFLGGLETQSPPLKDSLLKKVKEAKFITQQTLNAPNEWEKSATKLHTLLKGLL